MKNKKIGLILFWILFSLSLVSAMSITIDMKESFGLGEEIYFDYTIISEKTQEIEYIPWVNCPSAPVPLLDIKAANLGANIPLTGTYIYMSGLEDNIEPQICNATIGILEPEELVEKKSFEIKTNPGFEFNVLICNDLDCSEQEIIFILNEDIYLDYTSSIEELSVIATLRASLATSTPILLRNLKQSAIVLARL